MKVAIECYIELAGVMIDTPLLGQSVTAMRDTWAYRIDLPEAPDSFKFVRMSGPVGPKDEREYEPTLCYVVNPERGITDVRIVRVVVNADYDFDEDYDRSNPAHDVWAHTVFFEIRGRAVDAARDFTDLVRLQGQASIEPPGRYPRVLNMTSLLLLKGDEYHSCGWSIGQGGTVHIIGKDQILDQSKLDLIRTDLNNQRGAWVGELLVGEAMHLAESEQQTGPAQATLLGAMGVEVHTKDVLRRLANNDQRPVLDLLLDNPRDWSAAAHALFKKSLPTIVGKDLGTQHKTLSVKVQKLFEARNGVAHRGESISKDQAQRHVATAREAVALLRSLMFPAESRQS